MIAHTTSDPAYPVVEKGTKSMVLGALDIKTASVAIEQASFAVNAPFDVGRERVVGPGVSAFPAFDVILQLETPLVFNRCAHFDVEPRLRPERLKRENGSQPFASEIALNPSDGLGNLHPDDHER